MEARARAVRAMAAAQSHMLRTPELSSCRIFWKLSSRAPRSGLREATCSSEAGSSPMASSRVRSSSGSISTETSSSSKAASGGMGRSRARISPDFISWSNSSSGGGSTLGFTAGAAPVEGGGQEVMVWW